MTKSVITTKPETMSSSQLAEILHRTKKNVIRDIRDMFANKIDGSGNPPSSKPIKKDIDSRGYVIEYHLPELEAKMFVAKKDINYLEKVIQFWIDKKQQPVFKLPQNYAEALRALADTEEEKQAALLQIEQDRPKVAAFDLFLDTKAFNTITETAKILKFKPKKFATMLRADKIFYNLNGNSNTPYQRYIDKDLFAIKMNSGYSQTYVTQQGVSFLCKKYRAPKQRLLF